ncbi:MAG: hypothetical protein JSS23_03200 [Proteobacteria bacterium]|nr:hypothetical protein [Pseudomonadota bacterium]
MIRTDERYTTAITTDNLRMDTREHASIADVDVLTAAAWAPARMGAALLRLASEYDSAARAGHGTRMDAAMFVGKLRTLPEVRIQIAMQLAAWKVDDSHEAALRILAWWLHKVCGKCHGRGYDVVPGTARLSAKSCRSCDGSGESRIPCGEPGKRMVNYLDDCVHHARQSIRKGLGVMMGR